MDAPLATIANALDVHDQFNLSYSEAKKIIHEVSMVTNEWLKEAIKFGLSLDAIDRMETAFVHDESGVAEIIS
ncbi:MAG: hypothetical protein H8E51_09805 [Bacteroidetes bacterium]|nr:hypothetical protein [Bacteroidota bacterium]